MWVVQGFMEYCSFKYYLALQDFHSHPAHTVTRAYLAGRVLHLMKPNPRRGKSPMLRGGWQARGIVFQTQTARTIGTIARRENSQD